VLEAANRMGLDSSNVRVLGLPDRFIAHASRSEQLKEAALDAESLARAMRSIVQDQPARARPPLTVSPQRGQRTLREGT
jgi:deoxyxylulose-5-phosphate synthase